MQAKSPIMSLQYQSVSEVCGTEYDIEIVSHMCYYVCVMSKSHQVCLGHVLVIRRVVCCCFPKAIVTSGLWWLSMLPVCSALWSPAEEVDGFTNTALNVNFCANKKDRRKI